MHPSSFLLPPLAVLALAGCSALHRSIPATTRPAEPALPPTALLSLEQITPPATMPSTHPSTRPTTQASLDAIQLFAQARGAMDSSQRFTAVQLLDQAIALDPDSFELQMALGKASIGTSLNARALPAFRKAAQLDPNSTEAWIQMARLYLAQHDIPQAISHLRTAMQTSGYSSNAETALWVDYLLARALQQGGYDAAAVDAYDRVLHRLPYISGMYRGPVEVMQITQNPDLVFFEIATLDGRLRRYDAALAAIEQAMIESPQNQQYALTRVRLLMQAGKADQAREFMPEVISRFGSGVEVTSLLHEVFDHAGGDKAAAAELQKALNAKPGDRQLGFALADLLVSSGDLPGASHVLQQIVTQSGYEPDAVKRLFQFYDTHDRTRDAAELIIEATARRPEQLNEFAPLLGRLSRLSRSNHLKLIDLQQMQVPSWAEASRLFWVARLAQLWDRDELARAALEKAVRQGKPFAPAYRTLLNHYWMRRDWDEKRKLDTSNDLATLASLHGSPSLAAELRGMIALNQKKPVEASQFLLEAMRLGESAPEVQLAYASVQILEGNTTEAERTLLKITEDYPQFEPGYSTLIEFYLRRQMTSSAVRVLQQWIAADPHGSQARLMQAVLMLQGGRASSGEKILLDLFDEYSDSAEVLAQLEQVYESTNRLDQYINMLEQRRQLRPDIREIANQLVDIYATHGRKAEATRVVDDLRRNAGNDPDLLYSVAQLYSRLEDDKSNQSVLEQILRIDPNHSSAANDLGYTLADQGRDLDRAERLIRIAVKEEPDNQAFLDSLGWVMYKRGQFAQAHEYLERAIAQTVNPDPIVLDHLADTLYRLGRTAEATKRWEESQQRLLPYADIRVEYRNLQMRLQNKLQRVRQHQPVETAPLAAPPSSAPASRPA